MALTQQYKVTWNEKFYKVISYTASSAVAVSESIAPGVPFQLAEVRIMADATPTTSEDFTVTLNSGAGATFDQVIYSADLNSTDVPVQVAFDPLRTYGAADALDIAYTNTDTNTVTVEVIIRVPYNSKF